MSSNLVVYMIAGITMIVGVLGVFGFPALAIVAVRYFRVKERELVLEMEYRQKTQQEQLTLEQRVERLEETLASLDHDVRVRLGIDQSVTPGASRPELVGGVAEQEAQRGESRDPSSTRAR
jgi:hypothetical protein